MYNSDLPTRAELPSTTQLVKSTVIALLTAMVILVTIVLPAEYAIDPTGVGRLLKLTEMGEIKQQLAAEAEADRLRDRQPQSQPSPGAVPAPRQRSSLFSILARAIISPAAASERIVVAQAPPSRSDETTITLRPTEGIEYKMTLPRGTQIQYSWRLQGGVVKLRHAWNARRQQQRNELQVCPRRSGGRRRVDSRFRRRSRLVLPQPRHRPCDHHAADDRSLYRDPSRQLR